MKKFLIVVLCAVLFGGVAGATVLLVSNISNHTDAAGGEINASAEAVEETAKEIESNIIKSSAQTSSGTGSSSASVTVLDVSEVVEEAMPSVVSIVNTMVIEQQGYSSLYDYFYGGGYTEEYEVPASGSGVILEEKDGELLIVTNNHVIEGAKTLTVTFVDGFSVDALVKGADSLLDVAVIAIPLENIPDETMEAIKVATYHDDEDLKVGQGVIAIGNALGYGQTVTVGVISALNREITAEGTVYSDLIQTDAAINPGNSGGALLNMQGEVIALNVAKLSSTQVEGFGYSIPIYKVMDAIENLSAVRTKIELEESERGRMGIYMNTISEANASTLGIPAGVIIRGFSDEYFDSYGLDSVQESPAKEAGLLKNDIITAFDGQNITTAEELSNLVSYYEKGSVVTVTYERLTDGEYVESEVEVTLGALDDPTIEPVNADEVPQNAAKTPSGANGSGKPESRDEEDSDSPDSPGKPAPGENPGRRFDSGDLNEIFKEFLDQYQ